MKKKIIKWIAVILWMGIIFYFSNADSLSSTTQSRRLFSKTRIVEIYKEKKHVDTETALKNVDRIIRKTAHVIEYFVLAILLCIALSEYSISINKILLITFIICFIYSCSDEAHQLLVSGRSAEFRDILIDSIGISIGLLCYGLFKRRKS